MSVCICFGLFLLHSVIISSFNTGSHVTSSRVCNLCGIKITNPKDYCLGTNIEGGDDDRMANEVLHFLGVTDANQRIQNPTFEGFWQRKVMTSR